jgi:nitrate/nitrite transporter NarK
MSIMFWMPTFLVEEHRLSLQQAGFVVALGAGMTALSNCGGGYISRIASGVRWSSSAAVWQCSR